METIKFSYQAKTPLKKLVHVGVVGSGDLEILMEPQDLQETHVYIRTGTKGFAGTWEAILDRFFSTHDLAASIEINDFGATPGVVNLRLEQAWEVSQQHE
ncbi:malonate decarboxylase delta subunit [Virgibacillus natechei]|uniref:Malonate decarboxylase acyl carrier protein n=1 Tax=Virgibacillus natechei TaxID=1216297 RepID=A0ABS4IGG2_9BACI|nr:malonate decarboxylase subunit delta [Virgibacillus natechei]MBP1970034.1 malonate decarboxylase delta subunit [Virgibacillus natechei]UZD14120.1 malonate decarboxylase subunit delta [Virgibacillus natechei]